MSSTESCPKDQQPAYRRMISRETALIAVAVVVSALFAFNLVDHLIAKTLCCADDAFYAVMAKNLATDQGYYTSYRPTATGNSSPHFEHFDPTISLGPGLIVPSAIAMRILGNRYWVPGSVVLAFSILLLGCIFRHLARIMVSPRRWAPAVVIVIIALNLVTIGHYEHWYALLGEIPALLLLCLGVLRILDPRLRWQDHALGGLLLGWAYQVKVLAVLALPVVLFFLVLITIRDVQVSTDGVDRGAIRRMRIRRGLLAAVVATAFFSIPTLLFETYKLAIVGVEGYSYLKAAELGKMKSHGGSGLGNLLDGHAVEHIRVTATHNWQQLCTYFGTCWAPAAYLATLILGLIARRRWMGHDSSIPLTITAIAVVYTTWWLLLSSNGWIRHLLIGLGLWCLSVVLDLFLGRFPIRKWALALAFGVALLPRVDRLHWIAPPRPLFSPSIHTASMLATARYLEAHREGAVIVADWWASGVDMEYLLDGSGNLVHHQSLEQLDAPRVLFFENSKWIDLSPSARERWDEVMAHYAPTLVFEADQYRIYSTSMSDIGSFHIEDGTLVDDMGVPLQRDQSRLVGAVDGLEVATPKMLHIYGWMGDRKTWRPAHAYIVVYRGEQHLSRPSGSRPDLIAVSEDLRFAGFKINIPLQEESFQLDELRMLVVFDEETYAEMELGKKGLQ